MKLLLSVLASVALSKSDCGLLTQEDHCPAGIVPPYCKDGKICFNASETNKCAYACMDHDACAEPLQMWTKYELEADGGKKLDANGDPVYTEYCALHPQGYSYTCEWEGNYARVRASFPQMEKAADSDGRVYELYGSSFENDDYVKDMFQNVNEACKALINRDIHADTGTTVFDFPLSSEVVDACGMNAQEFHNVNGTYTDYNFAIGYDNLYVTLPGGLSAIRQSGRHTNLQCRVDRTAKKAVNLNGGESRGKDDAETMENFTMEISLSGPDGPWAGVDNFGMSGMALELGPEQVGTEEMRIRVKNTAEGRYVHMRDCNFAVLDQNQAEIVEFPIINHGCTINDVAPSTFYKDHTWIEAGRQNLDSDMFSMVFFDFPGAHSYEIQCNLLSCDPSNPTENCQPAKDCANRYSSFLAGRRRRRNVGANPDATDGVVTKTALFGHPCDKFNAGDQTGPLCYPEGSNNCWTRDTCENH